jgi:hypothetical protein
MHAPQKEQQAVRCPGCGERRMIEWDLALRRWVCAVCDRQWLPSRRSATACHKEQWVARGQVRRVVRGKNRLPNAVSDFLPASSMPEPYKTNLERARLELTSPRLAMRERSAGVSVAGYAWSRARPVLVVDRAARRHPPPGTTHHPCQTQYLPLNRGQGEQLASSAGSNPEA